jgi:putative transposase
LYEARRRFRLCVLNYSVTCNHVHVLVRDRGQDEIARSMQLVSGRVGQEFNVRKRRAGAFWEDRYHATAVESGTHLLRCSSYIDFNMVRAAVVSHPCEWETCGYRELLEGRQRKWVIDREAMADVLGCTTVEEMVAVIKARTAELIESGYGEREPEWTEGIAVGSEEYVREVAEALRYRKGAWHRMIEEAGGGAMVLHEAGERYVTGP